MGYVVFEDLQSKRFITGFSDTAVKIHKDSCRFYLNRKRDASTVRWHGPFNTLEEAKAFARQLGKSWRCARCCLAGIC